MKQNSFSDLEYANKKKTTRRERFLVEMNSVIPWSVLVKPIKRAAGGDRSITAQHVDQRQRHTRSSTPQ
jgi:transposase, IS5 family